ncbi:MULTISPECIES: DUF742 domain-containing protein [Actinomadura]|uniref:DUF742 domain-containing protein n=3 Tax=Actinomadura TaxID=1988 RepID=A0A5D0NWR2_9ACTN|nr:MULTISPECIES: DUF742 domain-containing protein [Actinomadura]TYB48421.1 DUF742 domain-containing protein [Actinomadura chibensis]TYC09416.1 DUF742 domain-containing protein [Actinomadura syzygii]TYK43254.1 DUF742 domain-containing protein [Actinomadura decatromicini]
MTTGDELWLDDDAGRLVRPYAVIAGRTRPAVRLDLLSLVVATGPRPAGLDLEHEKALDLCRAPTSVAEVSAYLGLPVAVTKVLLADLVSCRAMTSQAPRPAAELTDRDLLEKLLDGLQRA